MEVMTPPAGGPRLRLHHGALRRGRQVVLQAGAITAPAGAHVALVGLNGAGKTTLLLHAAGTVGRGRAMQLEVEGADGWSAVHRPRRALAPQQPRLPGWLRVADVLRLYGCEPDSVTASLPGLHIGELLDARTRTLSVGQAQAVSVALALAGDADLVLLDEPLASLDFRRRIGLLEALAARPRRGMLLMSAQAAADVAGSCDRVVVVKAGRYAWQGPVRDLIDSDDSGVHESAAPDAERLERRLLALLE
jgi:ABC-2 type transport system ATP-binding protein